MSKAATAGHCWVESCFHSRQKHTAGGPCKKCKTKQNIKNRQGLMRDCKSHRNWKLHRSLHPTMLQASHVHPLQASHAHPMGMLQPERRAHSQARFDICGRDLNKPDTNTNSLGAVEQTVATFGTVNTDSSCPAPHDTRSRHLQCLQLSWAGGTLVGAQRASQSLMVARPLATAAQRLPPQHRTLLSNAATWPTSLMLQLLPV